MFITRITLVNWENICTGIKKNNKMNEIKLKEEYQRK